MIDLDQYKLDRFRLYREADRSERLARRLPTVGAKYDDLREDLIASRWDQGFDVKGRALPCEGEQARFNDDVVVCTDYLPVEIIMGELCVIDDVLDGGARGAFCEVLLADHPQGLRRTIVHLSALKIDADPNLRK